jgi:hypothetical protein
MILGIAQQADFAKTMVAELKSTPFYKPNVLAMLNTLFPPAVKELPNDRIQPKVLHQYRSSFYRYITAVEANGPSVMKAFEQKLQGSDNRHSWGNTWDNLTHYMELAEQMIKQAEVAINLGIDMFVGGDYTFSSPLGLIDRPPSNLSTASLGGTTEASFDSSFQGPSTRSRTMMRGLSFSNLSFRTHSRSRTNTNNTASTFERPSLPQNMSFESASSSSTLVNTQGITPTSSFDATNPSTSFSSTASSARQSIYAANDVSASFQKPMPPLPRLDTDSIRSRQRAVSKPVMPFVVPDSPAAQSEAFSSTIVLKDKRKTLRRRQSQGGIDLIDRPSTSAQEKKSPKGDGKDSERPWTANEEKPKLAGLLKGKKSLPQLRRPTTSHGEKTPKAEETKMLKGKKSRLELSRPTTSHGEKASQGPQTPRVEFALSPARANRSSTLPGESTSRVQSPKVEFGPARANRSSTFPGEPTSQRIASPRVEFLPVNQTLRQAKGRPELRRPTASHGEKASQLMDMGSTIVRDFAPADQRWRSSTIKLSPQVIDFATATAPRDRSSTFNGRGKGKTVPAPLAELTPSRTISFYDAHMDSPSMPPPLSLGLKKLEPSPLGPNPPKKPPPAPSSPGYISPRKPTPSSIPLPVSRGNGPKNPLPSDGGAFLSKPYVEPPVIKRSLRKRPSFSSLFLRKSEDAKQEVAIPEPDALGISSMQKPLGPILKTSKSMEAVPKAKIGDGRPARVLKTQRSFGESLRAKFNMKSSAASAIVDSDDETSPVIKKDSEDEMSEGELIQRGKLEVEIEGWKPSYMIKDQSIPRTPRDLDSPRFDEFPRYDPGTVGLMRREVIPPKKKKWKREGEEEERDGWDKMKEKGGRFGQGKYVGQEFERPEGSLAVVMREQVGIEEPKRRAKERFLGQGRSKPKDRGKEAEMNALIRTTTEERLGPLVEEIKAIIAADEKPTIVVLEGDGDEDRPSPSDLGDETPFLEEKEFGPQSRLRASKSMGDLHCSNKDRKKLAKLVKKKSTDEVKTSGGITTAAISSPRLVALPEWEEQLEMELSKDYTRKYLMESARAKKGDWYLDPPTGKSVDRKVPRKMLKAMKRVEKMEAVKEEGPAPSLRGDLSLRAVSTVQGTVRGIESVYGSVYDSDVSLLPRGSTEDEDVDSSLIEEEKSQPRLAQKRVRILPQARSEYGREFEQPRATPKPPKMPEGRKNRNNSFLWTPKERESQREKELERQRGGTLWMLLKGGSNGREED